MKQYLTLRNVLKLGAFLFAIAAFCMMFGNQLIPSVGGTKGDPMAFDDCLFGEHGAVISFVGYLLMLIGGLIGCLLVFLKASDNIKKYVSLGVGVLIIVGAVFVFIEAPVFQNANNGIINVKYSLTAFPILGGIFGIIAGGAIGASEFLPDMPLVK